MTRAPCAAALALLAFTPGQQPTFRTATELVRVDVLVTRDGAPVTGLTAADFEVRDSGRPQAISAFGLVASVNAAIALDTSGSMTGDRLPKARAAALALLGELRPDESGTVVAFASQIIRLVEPGMPLDRARHELDRLVPAGSTALVDAAYAGVIAADTAPGPKLLVLLTDGRNNTSWLQAQDVIDAARRHEVVAYSVSVGGTTPAATRQGNAPTVDVRNGQFVEVQSAGGRARFDDADRLLRTLGRETGGRLVTATWNDDLSALFHSVLDEYRQRYILSFRPEGVPHGDGWHALTVRLRHGIKGDVYARSGYWSR